MGNADNLATRIAERDRAIAAEREKEWIVLANLGQILADEGPGADPDAPRGKALARIEGIVGEIEELEGALRRVLDGEERKGGIRGELQVSDGALKDLESRIHDAEEDLGAVLWDLWKNGPVAVPGLEAAMDEPIRLHEKLRDAEDALYRDEQAAGDAGGGRAVLAKGRLLLTRSRRRTAASAFERSLPGAARSVAASEVADGLAGTAADSAAKTLSALMREREGVLANQASLLEERKSLELSVEELPGKGGPKRRQSWIEGALEDKRRALDDAYRDLADIWLESGDSSGAAGEAAERKKELRAIAGAIGGFEAEKGALEARRVLLAKEGDKAALADKVRRLEGEIDERKTRLKALKKEMSSLEKEIDERRKTLPADPDGEPMDGE